MPTESGRLWTYYSFILKQDKNHFLKGIHFKEPAHVYFVSLLTDNMDTVRSKRNETENSFEETNYYFMFRSEICSTK